MSRPARTIIALCSIVALIWVVAARLTGPSDAWDKDQPKTMSYTTDIVLHGRWILPTEVGGPAATKPPLYNWIAAPFVAALGSTSEVAHRAPSMFAFIGCWMLLILIGRRMNAPVVGYLAALAFVLNAAMFRLGLLARTDMLLTFFLILGWMLATILLIHGRVQLGAFHRIILQLTFWMTVALAALTKGPPAIVLIIYALVAPRLVTGSWRDTRLFGWWWGVPIAIAPFAAWVYAAYLIDPQHVVDQLWGEEVAGRVTGLGDEGSRRGPIGFLYGLGHMPFYYITRFLPWSIVSILALIELRQDRSREERFATDLSRSWLIAAAMMLLIIIGFFTLSTGKRAAYIAAAYGPGAVLAAWWIVWFFTTWGVAGGSSSRRWDSYLPWVVAVATSLMLGVLTAYDHRDPQAPAPGFGDAIVAFIAESRRIIDREPEPAQRGGIILWQFDHLLTRAMLGGPFLDAEDARGRLASNEVVWVLVPGRADDPGAVHALLAAMQMPPELRGQPLLSSAEVPEAAGWPGQVTLWRLAPR